MAGGGRGGKGGNGGAGGSPGGAGGNGGAGGAGGAGGGEGGAGGEGGPGGGGGGESKPNVPSGNDYLQFYKGLAYSAPIDHGGVRCGDVPDGAKVVSLPRQYWEGVAEQPCGRTVTLWFNGTYVQAPVYNQCAPCSTYGVALSPALFEEVTGRADLFSQDDVWWTVSDK